MVFAGEAATVTRYWPGWRRPVEAVSPVALVKGEPGAAAVATVTTGVQPGVPGVTVTVTGPGWVRVTP